MFHIRSLYINSYILDSFSIIIITTTTTTTIITIIIVV